MRGTRQTLCLLLLGAMSLRVASPLAVIDCEPPPNAVGISWSPTILIRFTESLDPASVTESAFRVRGTVSGPIPGSRRLSADGRRMTFDPSGRFAAGELVEVTATRGLRSVGGDSLVVPYGWHFRTWAQPATDGFETTVILDPGYGAIAVAAGHLDQDGRLDLACARLDGHLAVFISTSESLDYVSYDFDIGTGLSSVVVRDFDNDGLMDVAAADQYANAIRVGRNLGDGTEFEWAATATCDHPQRLAAGDLDGDGNLDLAFACQWSDDMNVLLGDGAGGFVAPGTYPLPEYPSDAGMRDLDLDGDLDLAMLTRYYDPQLVTLSNAGTGPPPGEMFAPACSVAVAGLQGLLLADCNGDRLPDLVVATEDSSHVAVCMMQPGGCQPEPPIAYPTGGGPLDRVRGVAPLDFDGDGDLDLAVTNSDANVWVLMENDGQGAFAPRAEHPTGDRPILPCTADLDGDGLVDVAIPSRIVGELHLYSATRPAAGLADEDPVGRPPVWLAAEPNPFRDRVELRIEAGEGRLEVLDVSGRLIRGFDLAPRVEWDGMGADGRLAPTGTYFVRVRHEGRVAVLRLLRVR